MEVRQESRQDAIGLIQRSRLGQAEFADETILKGAPEAFNAAFGLSRVDGDLLDPKFFESPT